MQIPKTFKQAIADTFYDKDIEIWTSGTIKDDEGCVIGNGKLEKIDSFKGNFQFSTREYIQQEYGKEIEANAPAEEVGVKQLEKEIERSLHNG